MSTFEMGAIEACCVPVTGTVSEDIELNRKTFKFYGRKSIEGIPIYTITSDTLVLEIYTDVVEITEDVAKGILELISLYTFNAYRSGADAVRNRVKNILSPQFDFRETEFKVPAAPTEINGVETTPEIKSAWCDAVRRIMLHYYTLGSDAVKQELREAIAE